MAPTLWAGGNADAAIQVEQATEELVNTRNVDILCGYVLNSFQREQHHIYKRIFAAHRRLFLVTGYRRLKHPWNRLLNSEVSGRGS
jgi:hypothetical protein